MLEEFKKFLFRGNVVDLAVAVIIGTAFTAIVNAIVSGLITPLVGMIVSKDFTEMTFEVNDSVFRYGEVIDAVIRFVSIAAVVFFAVVKPVTSLMERRKRGRSSAFERIGQALHGGEIGSAQQSEAVEQQRLLVR